MQANPIPLSINESKAYCKSKGFGFELEINPDGVSFLTLIHQGLKYKSLFYGRQIPDVVVLCDEIIDYANNVTH